MLRKLSIIFIRLAPVLLAIKILVLLLAEYFVVSSLLIGLVSSITDLLIAIGLLILSLTFKFCIYHRLIIYYVFVSYISYIVSILFGFSLTNIIFVSLFLCLTIIIIFLCELSSPYAHGCQTDITHYFDSLSLMHDIQILLKRSCFLVEPSKTATFSDLVKVVGKRIKNEKHKFGVLYENGKLESHWLTNEEINNKTR